MAARKKAQIVNITRAKLADIERELAGTALEAQLLLHIRSSAILPEPAKKFQFAAEYGRKYETEFAYPDLWLLIELEGGSYLHERAEMVTKDGRVVKRKSRHLTPTGFHDDCDKYNFANVLGYHVLRFDAKHVESGQALRDIEIAYLAMTQYDAQVEAGIARAWGNAKKIQPITSYRRLRPVYRGDAS